MSSPFNFLPSFCGIKLFVKSDVFLFSAESFKLVVFGVSLFDKFLTVDFLFWLVIIFTGVTKVLKVLILWQLHVHILKLQFILSQFEHDYINTFFTVL